MASVQRRGADGPSSQASPIRKTRSHTVRGRSRSRAEKRISKSLENRVIGALEEAEASSMVLDSSSRRRASSWITRMAVGSKVDLRSLIFRRSGKPIPYAEIIAEFDKCYTASMTGVEPALVEVIWNELEEGNREKIGPKSMYKGYYEDGPKKLAAVMSDKPVPKELDRRALARARDRLVSEIAPQSIRLHDIDTVVTTERDSGEEYDPNAPGMDGTTNAGPDSFLGKWKPSPTMEAERLKYTQFVFARIVARAKELYSAMSSGKTPELMAMVSQRVTSRGLNPLESDKLKRLVLALEKPEAILWKMFTPQAYEELRHVKCPGGVWTHVAWRDTPAIDLMMQLMLDVAFQGKRTVLSGDISAFDQSVVPWIWEYMSEGISSWFYKAQKFYLNLNRSDIRCVKVLSPTGVTMPCPSSIKSGSGGTNFNGSQYNKFALFYGEEMGFYKLVNYVVQGDDFAVDGEGLNAEAVSEAYKHMGLTVHPDKQAQVANGLMFLQRLHMRGKIGGMASAYRTTGSALVYEKLTYKGREWNPYMEAIQVISKLENAAFHPAFEGMVDFVRSGDKYQLGANLRAAKVVQLAGGKASDLLAAQSKYTMNAGTLDQTPSGFDRAATNGVLRGESLPPIGSRERYSRVYGEERIAKATA